MHHHHTAVTHLAASAAVALCCLNMLPEFLVTFGLFNRLVPFTECTTQTLPPANSNKWKQFAPPGTTGMFASCAFAESSKLGLHS
jgi:hypothetical protein